MQLGAFLSRWLADKYRQEGYKQEVLDAVNCIPHANGPTSTLNWTFVNIIGQFPTQEIYPMFVKGFYCFHE